jgi:hypothetical protein
MARLEVLARRTDRELIRSLARALSEDDAKANRIHESLKRLTGGPPSKGRILTALHSSPLVGAELDLTRRSTRCADRDPTTTFAAVSVCYLFDDIETFVQYSAQIALDVQLGNGLKIACKEILFARREHFPG